MNQLYFIALIPSSPLREEIQEMKLEVEEKFNSSHSLNAPPHITLLSPFRLEDENETKLNLLLTDFAKSCHSFEVQLRDFSSFPPRVVFIDVEKTSGLIDIQQKLETLARSNTEIFNYNYDKRPYHPHVTLAFKDLTKNNFYKAWREFEERTFEASFKVGALFLLKHNGEKWEEANSYKIGKD